MVLLSNVVNPTPKLRIRFISRRNIAMTILLFELYKLIKVCVKFFITRIPDESDADKLWARGSDIVNRGYSNRSSCSRFLESEMVIRGLG